MNEKEQLDQIQSELKARGVKDVKFFVSTTGEASTNKVAAAAATFLRAILDGKRTLKKEFGSNKSK